MITIREIAAIAGVSRSTVSLVINNSPLVKPETRERVLQVIRDTGYVPNNNARNLNWHTTRSLGIVILSDQQRTNEYNFSNSVGLFSLNVMDGISSRLADTEYSVIIEYFSHDAPSEEVCGIHTPQSMRLPKLLRERKVDGAFIVGGYCEDGFLRSCLDTGIPLVAVGVNPPEAACDTVISDSENATYDAFRLLYERGRRRLALMNCPRLFGSSAMRLAGMRRFCAEYRLPFDEANVLYALHNNGESAYNAIRDVWEKGLRFDGLVAANPQAALGIMRYLSEQHVRIPQDISIIAYEDNALCGYAIPPLTAINIQKEKMGVQAAEMLLSRLENPGQAAQEFVMPHYTVMRSST